jgi:hypothetical protein
MKTSLCSVWALLTLVLFSPLAMGNKMVLSAGDIS